MTKSPNQTAGGSQCREICRLKCELEWSIVLDGPQFSEVAAISQTLLSDGRAVSISLMLVSQNHVIIPLLSSHDNTTMRWISPTHHILVDQPNFPRSLWWWFPVLLSFPINQCHHPLFQGVPLTHPFPCPSPSPHHHHLLPHTSPTTTSIKNHSIHRQTLAFLIDFSSY